MEYRVEDKYYITDAQIALLMHKLEGFVRKDMNGDNGSYLIRSVYYDDIDDSCLKTNEDGTDKRSKYRIRAYNHDDSYILLEKKSKNKGFTHKDSCKISLDDYSRYVTESDYHISESLSFLQKKFCVESQIKMLRPVVIVEYERTAYVETAGNVRITIDRNIGTSRDFAHFFDEQMEVRPIMPCGRHILEVKYDEILPSYIKRILDDGALQRISYSKYYMARTM